MGNNITLLTPKGEFNNNLFYAKGHVVYSGYSIYVSLVDDNNAELTDTNSWAMLLDGSKIGTAIAEVNDLNDNAGYRALVNKVNTLLAEYAKNEQSFTDTFNKNETKRQEDWYNQLKTDEEQYQKQYQDILNQYNSWIGNANKNATDRENAYNDLKAAMEVLQGNIVSLNDRATKNLQDAEAATTKAKAAEELAESAVNNANTAATNATSAVTDANHAANDARLATSNVNKAIDDAEKAKTEAEKAARAATDATKDTTAAKDTALDVANHPTYVGEDYFVYKYNLATKAYERTTIYVKGAAFKYSDFTEQQLKDLQGKTPKIDTSSTNPNTKTWWEWDRTINNGEGGYKDTGVSPSTTLTKELIESLLTGNITSHTHDQYVTTETANNTYAAKADVTAEITRAKAEEKKNADAIAANKSAINILNGDKYTEGSVKKAVADLVNGAPEAYNTLKEIADYIADDKNAAAAITKELASKITFEEVK